jgi:integrase
MLTDTGLKALQPKARPYKKSDEKGLFVIVRPNGARWWRFRYRYAGREKTISLGTYPDTSLKLARQKRDEARADLAANTDPSDKRQAAKSSQSSTFETVALEWLERQQQLSPTTRKQLRQRLDSFLVPRLGRKPIRDLEAPDLLRVLRRIESNGHLETAHRVRALASRVFRYAIATGRADRDPAQDLAGALAPVKSENFAASTAPKRIGELLRAIDSYHGQPSTMYALQLAPLVFVRPGELRAAEWKEFDLDSAEWRIPGARMKMGAEHVVPLSTQAIAILEELEAHTGRGRLLFPGLRSADRPISNNTLNASLRRLGFAADEMTAHGFRTMASTRLNELGYPPDVIELQLAHAERNKVRAAYNRAERLEERRIMMQAWADYLDSLKTGADIVAIGSKSKQSA